MLSNKVVRSIVLLIVIGVAGYFGLLPENKTQGTQDVSSKGASYSQVGTLDAGWSKTKPNINLTHVFFGEINRKGKPTGFHSRPGKRDPKNARVKQIKSGPNRVGVYTAQVEIKDQQNNEWKKKFSSFFPDSMSQQEVVNAIVNAYSKRSKNKKTPWEGPSGHGFRIQGYISNRGGINTAFPVYKRNG